MNDIKIFDNDDFDQTNQGERIKTSAPKWFVDELKKYISRNSIKTNAPEFAFYCACTWEAQGRWLNQENIAWAIDWIVSELLFPRLPADTDWIKPWREWERRQRKELLASVAKLPPPEKKKASPEAIKKFSEFVKQYGCEIK